MTPAARLVMFATTTSYVVGDIVDREECTVRDDGSTEVLVRDFWRVESIKRPCRSTYTGPDRGQTKGLYVMLGEIVFRKLTPEWAAYLRQPPAEDEFGSDDDMLGIDAEGWDNFAPKD